MLQGIAGDRDFLKLWFGETISDFGDQITLLAIPLTAVIVLKASAFEMGVLAAVATLPTALFSLVVGVWVDRVPRRRVLIAADIGRALVLATVPIAFVLGALSLPQLCGRLPQRDLERLRRRRVSGVSPGPRRP